MNTGLDGNTRPDSIKPSKGQDSGLPSRVTATGNLQDIVDINHPLSAIITNAHAARRWLNRPDPNVAEAVAALERIVKDTARIDDIIADLGAVAVRA